MSEFGVGTVGRKYGFHLNHFPTASEIDNLKNDSEDK